MSPRTGRPRTGQTPNISLRINPDAYQAARVEAVKARKTVGQWMEEAIREKIEREKEAGNVTKADC
jgi:predicted HicB family RNase H-like nuclease